MPGYLKREYQRKRICCKFFGLNICSLTQIARKIKNCPKFCQAGGGQCPPGPPTSYAYVLLQYSVWLAGPLVDFCFLSTLQNDDAVTCTDQQPPQHGGAVPGPVWVGSKWLLAFPRSQLPRHSPFVFLLCFPLNDRRRAAHSFFKIGRLFSLFLFPFSCPSLALLRLLILLLLLMSGNVHPHPALCALEMWPGEASQCNAALAPNGSI